LATLGFSSWHGEPLSKESTSHRAITTLKAFLFTPPSAIRDNKNGAGFDGVTARG